MTSPRQKEWYISVHGRSAEGSAWQIGYSLTECWVSSCTTNIVTGTGIINLP